MNTAAQKDQYIRELRLAATKILKGWEDLLILRKHWDGEDLGNVLDATDMIGDHEGLAVADLAAVIGTSLDVLTTMMDTNWHKTNFYKIEMDE